MLSDIAPSLVITLHGGPDLADKSLPQELTRRLGVAHVWHLPAFNQGVDFDPELPCRCTICNESAQRTNLRVEAALPKERTLRGAEEPIVVPSCCSRFTTVVDLFHSPWALSC